MIVLRYRGPVWYEDVPTYGLYFEDHRLCPPAAKESTHVDAVLRGSSEIQRIFRETHALTSRNHCSF